MHRRPEKGDTRHPCESRGLAAKIPAAALLVLTCRRCPQRRAGVRPGRGLAGEGSQGPRAVQRREEGPGAGAGSGRPASELYGTRRGHESQLTGTPPVRDDVPGRGLAYGRAGYADNRNGATTTRSWLQCGLGSRGCDAPRSSTPRAGVQLRDTLTVGRTRVTFGEDRKTDDTHASSNRCPSSPRREQSIPQRYVKQTPSSSL